MKWGLLDGGFLFILVYGLELQLVGGSMAFKVIMRVIFMQIIVPRKEIMVKVLSTLLLIPLTFIPIVK